MIEFRVNRYISLRLKNNISIIYVNNIPSHYCKSLLIEIPQKNLKYLDNIDKIIEETGQFFYQPPYEYEISPEDEFWGHCSNLQAWAENNYNTQLIHSNLAFPLLKNLVEAGDIKAKKVFKDEIARRFIDGGYATVAYLIKERFLNYLNEEEQDLLIKMKSNDFWKDFIRVVDEEIEFDPQTDEDYMVFESLIKNRKLFRAIIEASSGKDVLRLIDLWTINDEELSEFINEPNSFLLKSLLRALKYAGKNRIFINDGVWNRIYKAGKAISKNLKDKLLDILQKNDYASCKILFKLRWIDYLKDDDFVMILNNTKIDLLKKLALTFKELFTVNDLGKNSYYLEFFISILHRLIFINEKKYWNEFRGQIKNQLSPLKDTLEYIKKKGRKNILPYKKRERGMFLKEICRFLSIE